MTIGLHTTVVRADGLLTATVGDEIVILNPDHDDYLGLDSVGRAIWDLLEQRCEVAHLCRLLAEAFAAPPAQIERDVLAFLAQMADEGVVHVVAP